MSTYRKIGFLFLFIFITGNLSVFAQAVKKATVPDVVGMTLKDARKIIRAKNMEIGAIIYTDEPGNTGNLFIIKQAPAAINTKGTANLILKQKLIDLWVVSTIFLVDSLQKPPRKIKVTSWNY